MQAERRLTAFLLFLAIVGSGILVWRLLYPWIGSHEADLFQLIAVLEERGPIQSKNDVDGVIPCLSPDHCRNSGSCEAKNFRKNEIEIDEIDLRPQKNGSILVLSGFGNKCIKAYFVFQKYPNGKIHDSCDHKYCPYYSVERPWGQMSFGLPDDIGSPQCVESVVLESGSR